MVELLSGEVCEAPLKKKSASWSDGLEFGLRLPLNIQKQHKRYTFFRRPIYDF